MKRILFALALSLCCFCTSAATPGNIAASWVAGPQASTVHQRVTIATGNINRMVTLDWQHQAISCGTRYYQLYYGAGASPSTWTLLTQFPQGTSRFSTSTQTDQGGAQITFVSTGTYTFELRNVGGNCNFHNRFMRAQEIIP